jgi:hypothetical protein
MPDTGKDLIDRADRLEADIRAGTAGSDATAIVARIDALVDELHRYQSAHHAEDLTGFIGAGFSDYGGPIGESLYALAWLRDHITANGVPSSLPGATIRQIIHGIVTYPQADPPRQGVAPINDQATLERIIRAIEKQVDQGGQQAYPPDPEVPQLDLSLEPDDAVPTSLEPEATLLSRGDFDQPFPVVPPPLGPPAPLPASQPAGASATSSPVRDDTLKGSFSDVEPLESEAPAIDYRTGPAPERSSHVPGIRPTESMSSPRNGIPSVYLVVGVGLVILVVAVVVWAGVRGTNTTASLIADASPHASVTQSSVAPAPTPPIRPTSVPSESVPSESVPSESVPSESVPRVVAMTITDNKLVDNVGSPCTEPTTLHVSWVVSGAPAGASAVVSMTGPGLPPRATFAIGANGAFGKDYTVPAGAAVWTTTVVSIAGIPAPRSNATNRATVTCG